MKASIDARASFTQPALDHYKEAFAGHEDPSVKGSMPAESLRNALGDCGVVFTQQEFTDILLPAIPTQMFNNSMKTLSMKGFLEVLKFAMPLVPPRRGDDAPDAGGRAESDVGVGRRMTRRLSRKNSSARDPRSENARALEKLYELRERLADGLSAAVESRVIENATVQEAPKTDSDGEGSADAAVDVKTINEEELVRATIQQLELLGFNVPGEATLAADQPLGAKDGGYSAAAISSHLESLIQAISTALADELEWVEAYSADDLVVTDALQHRDGPSKHHGILDAARLQEALRELEDFSFNNASDYARKQGSHAFRHRTKDFPFFMFPIDSVCARLDALDDLQGQYDAALQGHEFYMVPKCTDGRSCRLQDVPEHRLEYSHPCFSEEIPCPHRHRALHMRCYSHPEDDNPDFDMKMKSLQRRLGVIELSGMELGDAGAQCLAYVLQQDRHREGKPIYTELHMSANHVSPGGAMSVLDGCHHLVHLDLSGNALGYKTVALLQTSAIGPSLQALLTKSERLLTLNLSRNRLSDRDGRYICEGLKTNTVLRHLDLRRNDLGATFGVDMAAALSENRDLRELLLGWNRLESSGSSALLQEMKTSSTLEMVDLSWTGISDEGAKAVAEMIAGSVTLRVLSLAHNNIGPDGTIHISKALSTVNKTLQSLDLSFNPIGTKSACEIIKDLRDNTSLELIDLRCVKASEEVTEEIKRLIKIREPRMQQQGLKMTVLFSTSMVGGGGPTFNRAR